MPSPSANFDGTTANGSVPPDPSGAAGPSQYLEVVNTKLAVYSKTGKTLLGPEATNTLWSGFGGGCEKNNNGDGTVLFDTIDQRWVVQQFSVSTTPYLDCVAVSKTSDSTGEWYRYSFQYEKFPDYPKIGVWPDAYYASVNLFNLSPERFEGAEVCAFNRAAMLKGEAASKQCFVGTEKGGASLLPATLDGTTQPPSGEPAWFVALSPTEANALAYWKFHIDWSHPANTTFTGPTNLPVEPFSQACGGGACIPQKETSQLLASLGDRLMFRLAYRNFRNHEAMVVAHAVAAGGGSVGMRWYELRPSGGALTVYQQGTYAPDSADRWMGSIAMDHIGDMGLGYSVSSSSLHPQIRYTGRLAGDLLGKMPEGEATLYEGAGSQLPYPLNPRAGERWGDYTEMSVDPSDDCTFWYVNEYLPSNGDFNWHTRIGSFTFPGCPTAGHRVAEGTSPASVLNASPLNSEQWVFYVNSEREIAYWHNSPSTGGWVNGVVGGSVKAGTSPTAVGSGGNEYVYYVNTNGEITNWTYSAEKWIGPTVFGGKVAANSSPAAALDPSNNHQFVYFVNSSSEIAVFTWAGVWTGPVTLGGKAAMNTSPTALAFSSNSFAYYSNTNREITNWTFSQEQWIGPTVFGGKVATNSSPTAAYNKLYNFQYVYYVNSNAEVADFAWTGSWTGPTNIGGKVASGSSPTALAFTNGNGFVYFANAPGTSNWTEITNWTYSEGQWIGPTVFGGKVAANSSPNAVFNLFNSYQYVYFVSNNLEIANWTWTGSWIGPTTLR
jgi:hypothetical protein